MWERFAVAMRVLEVFEDDLDGGKADATVSFSLEGASYEIDLSEANVERLRGALQPFIEGGRRVAKSGRAVRGQTRREGSPTPAQIREWAKQNGYQVNERGRISADVIAAYEAAHAN